MYQVRLSHFGCIDTDHNGHRDRYQTALSFHLQSHRQRRLNALGSQLFFASNLLDTNPQRS